MESLTRGRTRPRVLSEEAREALLIPIKKKEGFAAFTDSTRERVRTQALRLRSHDRGHNPA